MKVKFQPQTFKVARLCVRKRGEGGDVKDAELDPHRERLRCIGADLGSQQGQADVGEEMEADREDGSYTSGTGTPESASGPKPEMIPVPDSPPLPVELPSPRVPSGRSPHSESSFDKTREPLQAPAADGAQNDKMT